MNGDVVLGVVEVRRWIDKEGSNCWDCGDENGNGGDGMYYEN